VCVYVYVCVCVCVCVLLYVLQVVFKTRIYHCNINSQVSSTEWGFQVGVAGGRGGWVWQVGGRDGCGMAGRRGRVGVAGRGRGWIVE